MYKLFGLILFLSLASYSLYAQDKKSFGFGIYHSHEVNYTKLSEGFRTGYHSGVRTNFLLNKMLTVQASLVYGSKKYSNRISKFGYYGIYQDDPEIKIDYLDLLDANLNFRFHLRPEHNWRPGLFIGISTYFILRERHEIEHPFFQTEVLHYPESRTTGFITYGFFVKRRLNDNMEWIIECYHKLPLMETDFGEARIHSIGIGTEINFLLD